MKSTWLILLLLLQAELYVSGQPYQSIFGNNSTEWRCKVKTDNDLVDLRYCIEKDTIVNNVLYKKLVGCNSDWAGGLLREEINTGIVWYRDVDISGYSPKDTFEMMVLNMNLKVGDSFNIYKVLKYYQIDTFALVDSVKYINGLKHIYLRAQYNAYNEPYTMIEGIGSNLGIRWKQVQQWSLDGYPYLLCSYKDGQKTAYQNLYYKGDCTFSNVETIDAERNIVLYPQPATGIVSIYNSTNHKITKVEIINPMGALIKRHSSLTLIKGLEIEGIPAGYYFIKLFTSNGNTIVKSMIIN